MSHLPQILNVPPGSIALVLSVLPAVASWWWHRLLDRGADEAVLAERVSIVRQRVGAVTGASMTLIAFVTGPHMAWAWPLLLFGLACATHPARTRLLGETWRLHEYIASRLRTTTAVLGFWVLLAATPALVVAFPPAARWWATAGLIAVLLAWHHAYPRLLLLMVGASPLERPDLRDSFAQVLDRATTPPPALWRAGMRGGVFANALALPSTAESHVLFFDTLLERLTPAEITAVFAHEVAHLEYYDRRRIRRMYVATSLSIVLAVAGTAAIVTSAPSFAWIARPFWPMCVLVGLVVRASRMQLHETNSDLRAVELCGEPEALVSGLTRLYAINRVPRRWSNETERHASHPSLARRIRAIRASAAGSAPLRLEQPVVIMSSEAGRLAILDRDRLAFVWTTDGMAPELIADPVRTAKRLEAIAYDQLTELRVITTADGVLTLTAVGVDGTRRSMPLQHGEAARLQAALNTVDQLLAAPTRAGVVSTGRRLAAFVAIVMASALRVAAPIFVAALLALWRPRRPVLLALASALVMCAFVTADGSTTGALRATILPLLAAAALWQARQLGEASEDTQPALMHAELLGFALPAIAGVAAIIAANQFDLFGLHRTTRDAPWLPAWAVALAVYLATSPVRLQRRFSLAAAALAAAAVWVGSASFLTGVVADPLAVRTRVLTERTLQLTPVASASVDGRFSRIRLAEDGRHFLLSEEDDEEHDEDMPLRHVVGSFDGGSRRLDAAQAMFVGGDRLLVLERQGGDVRLRAEPLDVAKATWTLPLPRINPITMAAERDGRWHVIDRSRNHFHQVEGRVGATNVVRTTWKVDASPDNYLWLHPGRLGRAALGVAVDWHAPKLRWFSSDWQETTTLLRVEADRTTRIAESRLSVDCADPAPVAAGHVCTAYDGRVSWLWQYNAVNGRLEPAGQIRGHFWLRSQETSTSIEGERSGRPAVVQLDTGMMTTFTLLGGGGDAHDIAGDFIASVEIVGDRSTVLLYRMSDERPDAERYAAASASTR